MWLDSEVLPSHPSSLTTNHEKAQRRERERSVLGYVRQRWIGLVEDLQYGLHVTPQKGDRVSLHGNHFGDVERRQGVDQLPYPLLAVLHLPVLDKVR
jgi:hypothetical protein